MTTTKALICGATLLAAGCASDKVCPLDDTTSAQCDPTRINTRGWEDSPYVSLDGSRLYFMYSTNNFMPVFRLGLPERRGPQREGYVAQDNPFDEAAVYRATRNDDGTWSTPEWLPVNETGTTCCLMTYDENRYYFQAGNDGSQDLVTVDVDDDGDVGDVVFLGDASSSGLEDNPHATEDGDVIWFTSDRSGGEGARDLWVTVRDGDGNYGAASNVTSLSSSEEEDQIWVRPDGAVAYFNRGGRIFRAEREVPTNVADDNWGDATEVLFDGESIEGAEASLTADESRIVFARVDRDIDDIVIVEAIRGDDGEFGAPVAVD